jgi:hypothetical protein
VRVGERPAGVARCQADVSLHPRLRAEPTERANGMNHTSRERTNETQRIAYGDGEFSRADLG